MKYAPLAALIAVLFGTLVQAQEIQLVPKKSEISVVPGEPIRAAFTIKNDGAAPLEIVTKNLVQTLTPSLVMLNGDGSAIDCWTCSGSVVRDNKPQDVSTLPHRTLAPEETLTLEAEAGGLFQCPLQAIGPGTYTCQARVGVRIIAGGVVRDLQAQARIIVHVVQPSGVDEECLRALNAALAQYEKSTKHPRWGGRPLFWGEVLSSMRIPSQEIVLSNFPTSTYAGYILAKKAPDYSNPLFKPAPPADQVHRSREEGRIEVAFPDKSFEAYFGQLDHCIQGGHVPDSLRAVLYGLYGDLLVRRGRFADAERVFQEATKGQPADSKGLAYYHRSQEFLRALGGKVPPASGEGK